MTEDGKTPIVDCPECGKSKIKADISLALKVEKKDRDYDVKITGERIEPLEDCPNCKKSDIMTNEKPLWKCVGCGKKTTYHGIPFTACETCQPIIENFVKARKGLNDVFRSAVESQMREQFEKTIQSRISEFEKKRDKAKENKDMELAFEITFLLLELEKLKEGIK